MRPATAPQSPDGKTSSQVAGTTPVPSLLAGWNIYFIFKLLLFWRGLIDFHGPENLVFFALLALPLPRPGGWRLVRLLLAIPAGVALLYHDSYLPPVARLLSQVGAMTDFSLAYMIELSGRFVSWPVLGLMLLVLVLLILLVRFVRIGVLVLGAMVALTVVQGQQAPIMASTAPGSTSGAAAPGAPRLSAGGSNAELNRILQTFYASEARRQVRLPTPAATALPFDILFIHVCSLSWDDLHATGLDLHPLWKSFDIVFRRFNSAASYSGPAAVRLNRATCGQTSNAGLYTPATEQCYLMPSLKRAGFDINFAMNHDGHFDDFLQLVRQQGVQAPPLPLSGLPVTMKGFDDSPIHGDAAVLARWRAVRATSAAPRTALYYNTISLHDGNRLTDGTGSGLGTLQNYKVRLTRLFDEMEALMQALASGQRRTVVVLIPEHGAAMRGDRLQIAGLREIPTPAITTVPVGIRVIDPASTGEHDTEYVDQPSSFLALSQLIANMLATSPFGPAPFNPRDYTKALPATDFVAENQVVVMGVEQRYFWREDKVNWQAVPVDQSP
ncbi:MAG: cellulose biosynthesis protein BcsG [Herminiimonas sp.]|nr:cellulose biosynthesis protein BcsG [Herminiimonas sp.]